MRCASRDQWSRRATCMRRWNVTTLCEASSAGAAWRAGAGSAPTSRRARAPSAAGRRTSSTSARSACCGNMPRRSPKSRSLRWRSDVNSPQGGRGVSKTISIVTPFFNEGSGIERYYEAMVRVMNSLRELAFEVVCVDDGSTDDTLGKLIALTQLDPRFRVIELSRNFGKEAALTAGIDMAEGDAVIPIDADLQDPPELIPAL